MYAKVYGPYTAKDGIQRVVVVHKDENGHITKQQTVSYRKYLEEYDQGLHRYKEPPRVDKPLSLRTIRDRERRLNPPVVVELRCSFCRNGFESYNENKTHCSESCKEKHKRRLAKRNKIIYHKQVVISISDKDSPYYFVLDLDRDKRDPRLVKQSDCVFVIKEDTNGVIRYRLEFDLNKSVRIRPITRFKKRFWITENALLVSRVRRKICSQVTHIAGYKTHCTRIGGRNGLLVNFRIHVEVARAFIPNPMNKPQVNHIDGIKDSNHVSNLEWVTNQENAIHALRIGLVIPKKGEDVGNATLTNRQAAEIRFLSKVYSRKELGDRFSVSTHVVGDVLRNTSYLGPDSYPEYYQM